MFKKIFFALLVLPFLSCQSDDSEGYEPIDLNERLYAGGETTLFTVTSNAYRTPAPNLSAQDLAMHLLGDVDFESVFVTAPSSINQGLGPIFNNSSCISCHPRDGRAGFPTDMIARGGLLMRASIPGQDEHGGPLAAPGFGLQVQNQALFGYMPEARYDVTFTETTETLADGTVITLRKPGITLIEGYTAFPAGMMTSPRIGPPVFGLGLLEAIPEADILARQDISDNNGDGISGKANYVWDPHLGQTVIGRFGWKANTGTIRTQCAAAYVEDMGITNSIFHLETGHGQSNGSDGFPDDPELPDNILDQTVLYCRTLAVPAPRGIESRQVREGAAVFERIGCTDCHTPRQQSGHSQISAISNQVFYPYTDMLLHDMGEGLADNRPDFLADGREWKTRPLWGIGLTELVNGHTNFLHDGRARNLTEAILWHGGEGQRAKDKFKSLGKRDREALLAFLNSL
ncbi:di-heme oxidoredictase family protein [uncultured Flavobacterium sp.]|uniref:di-heme oxidoreductase family protein n=1 Tax=uncultured Flavobacterium sp. TaxID=165435 RepID=UPI0025E7C7CC|nr:di-heme oxidoredictase family protein [uncultured Flavobacterium sp.]